MVNGVRWSILNVGATSSFERGTYHNYNNAKYICPLGWRLPTAAEINSIVTNYSDEVAYSGKEGRWFSGNHKYSKDAPAIFFPEAGGNTTRSTRYETPVNETGYYWSSTEYETSAKETYYTVLYVAQYMPAPPIHLVESECIGISVRCVKE